MSPWSGRPRSYGCGAMTDKRGGRSTPTANHWLVFVVAVIAFTTGFVVRTLLDAGPRYTTFAGCLMTEMQGRQEKLINTAAQLCHEKVAAGEIRK